MKKLISIILSLALVACMFGMSAMAADVNITDDDIYHVVGEKGKNIDYTDGDDAFTSKSAQAVIKMSLEAATSRYAVDIVFDGTFTIEVEDLTWDVNQLAYITESDEPVTDREYSFKVTNYSDKPVTVKASCAVADNVGTAGVTCEFGTVDGQVEEGATAETHVIKGNAHKSQNGPTHSEFSATLTSDDWAATVNKLIAGQAASEFTFATFTVTVSK